MRNFYIPMRGARTLGPELIQMVNQVTNRILGLAEKRDEAVQ
jgi:hypothetical protein